MHILKAHINAFGRLRDVVLDDLDHAIVVVLGPNEAGKSTLFHFLTSMVYGFYPAKRDDHPYAPEDGSAAAGSLTFRLEEGAIQVVSRRLTSSPSGTLRDMTSDETSDQRNLTLSAAGHISKQVFDSVFALTLSDMSGLSGRAWQEVQDRLLGGLNFDFVRPVSDVLKEIDEEASRLWRPDKRGKPRARELEQRLRDLRSRLADAAGVDESVRRLTADILKLNQEIDDLKEEQVVLTARDRTLRLLIPIGKQHEAILRWREDAGDVHALSDLPTDPEARLQQMRAELEGREEELRSVADECRDAERVAEAFNREQHPALALADGIERWIRRIDAHQQKRQQLRDIETVASATRRQLALSAETTFSAPWTDTLLSAVTDLPIGDVRHAASEVQRLQGELERAQTEARSIAAQRLDYYLLIFGSVFLLIAIGLTVLHFLLGGPGYGIGAGVLAVVGALFATASFVHRGRVRSLVEDLDTGGREAAFEGAVDRFSRLVRHLPLSGERTRRPDVELVNGLLELKRQASQWIEQQERSRTIATELAADEKEIEQLALSCGLTGSEEPGATISKLEEALVTSRSKRAEAEAATTSVRQLRERIDGLQGKLDLGGRELSDLQKRLSDLGDGDTQKGIAVLAARRRAAHRADDTEDQLRREYPDLEDRLNEIARLGDADFSLDQEEVVRIETRLEHISEKLTDLTAARTGFERDREHAMGSSQADEVASEMASIREEMSEVWLRHDRLRLLGGIIRAADTRFRLDHQPDVLKRASRYLSTVTGDRYHRLMLTEGTEELLVFRSGNEFPITVEPPLSQGTRDQVYLALRLALADHLDDGRERLPLILDEVFVNWDAGRREGGFRVLEAMSKNRQLFLFTCHPWLAKEVADQCKAGLVSF